MNNNLKMVIALDNGKMNVKIKSEKKEIVYRNKYSEEFTDDLLGQDTFNVSYKGKNLTIGKNANDSDRNEGKGSEIHIVQALTAITRVIEPNEHRKITLIYGESVDMYFNQNNKINIKMALEGNHTIYVDGVAYKFEIEYVQILPEGVGHILQDFDSYTGVQYVVDIGGGTINFLTVKDGRPESKKSKSLPLGVNNIVEKIVSEIKRLEFGQQDEMLILEFLEHRERCKNRKILEIIDQMVINQLKEFDKQVAGLANIHKILKVQPVMFLGGGAELLKYQINKHYKSEVIENLVIDNALYANVRGFYEFGVANFLED